MTAVPTPAPTSGALANLMSRGVGGPGAGSGVQSFADPTDPQVWLGGFDSGPNSSANKPLPGGGRVPKRSTRYSATMPMSAAQSAIYGWSDPEVKAFARKAWYLGYNLGSPDDVSGAIKVWQMAVEEAAKSQAAGKYISPNQILELYAGGNADKIKERMGASGGSSVAKRRDIRLSDPVHARALITQAFQDAYGRDPTDAEIRTLTSTLNGQEKAHPVTTTQTTSADGTTTSAVTSGGIDPAEYLAQQTKNDPEAAAMQAATAYFPALMQMLGSPIG